MKWLVAVLCAVGLWFAVSAWSQGTMSDPNPNMFFGGPPPATAAATNAPAVVYWNLKVPVPVNFAAWVSAHAVLLWVGMRFLIKWLDGYQAKSPLVARLLWVLEHVSLNKNVATMQQRTVPPTNGLPTGITPTNVNPTAAASPAIIVALVLLMASTALAATNTVEESPSPAGIPLKLIQAVPGVPQPISQFATIIQSNVTVDAGAAANVHGSYGPSMSQQLNLFGFNATNQWLHIGLEHSTAFLGKVNWDGAGVHLAFAWDKAPGWLKFVMFKADNVIVDGGIDEPWGTWEHIAGHPDWKNTFGHISIGRKI